MIPAWMLGYVLLSLAQISPDAQPDQLRDMLDADQKRLAAAKTGVANVEAEYAKALTFLARIEESLGTKQAALEELRAKGGPAADVEKAERDIASQTATIASTRKRLDIVAKEKATLAEIAESLAGRIKITQALMAQGKPAEAKPAETPKDAKQPEKDAKAADAVKAKDDKRIAEAREAAEKTKKDAEAAHAAATTFADMVDSLRKEVEAETKLLNTARERWNLARERKEELETQLDARRRAAAPEAEINSLLRRIQLEDKRINEARAEEKRSQDHLTKLHTDLGLLQSRQIMALQEADKKREEAAKAGLTLADLENPFSLRAVATWFVKRGPRVLFLLLVTLVVHRLVQRAGKQFAHAIARSEKHRRSETEDSRAETLSGVFRNSLSSLALLVGGLMVLDEAGIPVSTLLGGAAVLGLAVSFGAQNLIKDYFGGFMILLEDQYGVGDWVAINGLEGTVEHISMRITSLRDTRGRLHIVPHGTITSVTNMTHTWSQAQIDVGVAYSEDVDRVMLVLVELCNHLQRDPVYGPQLLGSVEMLGVENLGDSAVTIRFRMKTRPGKQWAVQRELLRRVKIKFDELGIEIPFPQRVVTHVMEEGMTMKLANAA